jgi:hypothetical protein
MNKVKEKLMEFWQFKAMLEHKIPSWFAASQHDVEA